MKERKAVYVNGYLGLVGLIILVGAGAVLFYLGMTNSSTFATVIGFIFFLYSTYFT